MDKTYTLTLDEFNIIQNALMHYKKVERKGKYAEFTNNEIDKLRKKLQDQMAQ